MELTTATSPNPSGRTLSASTQLTSHPLFRQLLVMVGIAISVAIGVAVVLWSQTPSYSLLYGNLGDKGAQEVLEALQKAGVEYRVEAGTGAVMVPSRKLHEVRMKLAAHGLPHGDGLGFELLQQDTGLGTSQLLTQARHHRALEGELARTIATLSAVEGARVHLALPKQSVFVRKRVPPTASVVVQLHAGRSLERPQVDAIVHLIASSVPELEASHVTVVDQKGTLLNGDRESPEMRLTSTQFEYARQLEDHYRQRIETLLAPIVGAESVRAQVTADIDFTVTEQTEERFNPDQPALRSEQVNEESSRLSAVQGVPGALSNQPPAPASAPEKVAAQPGSGAKGATPAPTTAEATKPEEPLNTSRRATRNFELDKTISHIRHSPASLRRLSVAVVVDDALVPGAEGEPPVRRERTPEEIERIAGLVRESVGYNAQRGDSVRIVNAAFRPAEEVEASAPALWEEAWFWDLLRQVGGLALALVLIMGVLRPTLKRLMASVPTPALAVAGAGGDQQGVRGELDGRYEAGAPAAVGGPREQVRLPGPGNYQETLDAARGLVKEDPKRVAQLVKTWVGENG
jgi:flagellar M-ring protein FliF